MPTVHVPETATVAQLYGADQEHIERAKARQCALWRGETPDAWPIAASMPLTDAQKEGIPAPNLEEAFHDPDLMVWQQLRGACGVANARSDAVPSVRANTGTGTLLSCLGLEQEVFPDKMPWLQQHLTAAQVAALTPADIQIQGTFERALAMMRHFNDVFARNPPTYCPDTQGPFDLAHLMLGDDIFLLMHDDPGLVHHALEISVELVIRTTTWAKEVSGEPPGRHYHGNRIYAENMGIRICEDTTAIVGPEAMQEFAIPYTQRLAAHFGGAWVHYCGRSDALTDLICALPEVRGINFGHIPGHEHDHVFEEDMQRCLDSGTVYTGNWPRRPGETGPEFLCRMHEWAAKGVLFPDLGPGVEPDGKLPDVPTALEYWYGL